MKKLSILALVLTALCNNSYGQKKWSIGFGAQTFKSSVYNVGQNEQTFWDEFNQQSFTYLTPNVYNQTILSYGGHFIADKRISKKSSWDIGLGIQNSKNNLFLDNSPDTSEIPSNQNMLNIVRTQLYLPANFNYFTRLGSNVCLKTSLGFVAHYLIKADDNYSKNIRKNDIYIDPNSQYSKINLLGKAKVGLRYESDNKPNFEFNLFYNYGYLGAIGITGQTTGIIYNNLNKATDGQLGLEFNYFIL